MLHFFTAKNERFSRALEIKLDRFVEDIDSSFEEKIYDRNGMFE
jgi:hypothetical protein